MVKGYEEINDRKIRDVIKNITSLVFDKKNWFQKEMWKIAEVTYSYTTINPKTNNKLKINNKIININTTLFISLGELDLDLFENKNDEEKIKYLEKTSKKIQKKLEKKINQIINSIKEIKFYKKNLKKIKPSQQQRLKILKNSLEEKIDLINYWINWLDFELEKATNKTVLTKKEEKNINKKQKKLDKKLFWGEIRKNKAEVEMCLNYIIEALEKNKNNLTNPEYLKLLKIIAKAKKFTYKNYKYKKQDKPKNILNNLEKYTISREDYILGFNLFIEAFSKMQFNVETNPFAKSISDWPRGFQIPTTKKFDIFTLPRFLLLNSHENETHNISEHNSKKIIWKIRWKSSTEKDEWVAILMENMIKYWNQIFKKDKKSWKIIFDTKKLQFNSNFLKIFFWEIMNSKDFFEFLELLEKIDPDNLTPKDRFDRIKRSNKNFVQHKDTTYTRWMFFAANEVNKYILTNGKKWINFYDLFIWKVGFEDIEKLKKISKEENIKILKPMFLSDIIYFSIKNRLTWEQKINNQDVEKFIKSKYPIIDLSENIINNISKKKIKNIEWITSLVLKNIFAQEKSETIIEVRSRVDNLMFEKNILIAKNNLSPLRKKALIKK